MNVLAIDSSNVTMGVAILSGDTVLGELITNSNKNHSVRLMPAIEKLFNDVNIKPVDIDRIAVAAGPGSYTGVRIGVTIAKTMAWALKKELVGVSSLEVLAQNGIHFSGYIVPIFDARRGQVYTSLYVAEKGEVKRVKDDQVILLKNWLTELSELNLPILFLGNDVAMHWETIVGALGELAIQPIVIEKNPRPSLLGYLGMKMDPVPIHTFTPHYLQLAEAEAKWLKKQEGEL